MFCEDKKCPVYVECMERLEALPYCASKAAELSTTANQQLKAEIAALADEADKISPVGSSIMHRWEVVQRLRQLSSVEAELDGLDAYAIARLAVEKFTSTNNARDAITPLVVRAVNTDGCHHKQWYLEAIAEALQIELPPHDLGIAP